MHLALEVGAHIEAPWFAIVIGVLTGLGVRQANKAGIHHVSYARGAVSGIIALAAIVGSIYLVSVLMAKKDTTRTGKPVANAAPAADAAAEDAEGDDAAEPAEEPAAEPIPEAAPVAAGGGKMGARAEEFNPWQAAFMAIGAFLAYELGRGSAPRPVGQPAPEQPVYTDPSN
jgi:hypothetical protein